jgi:hypothetical protein
MVNALWTLLLLQTTEPGSTSNNKSDKNDVAEKQAKVAQILLPNTEVGMQKVTSQRLNRFSCKVKSHLIITSESE